ncbi:UDP-2,3-diacylglucosamine hydrolase [Salinisphaera shabanensis T35B1]|uniref:UDP-2,3-diacylglucosamine hydrolase n=1 Tax=Salinisphaera shabanensis E1L3A TaxID=1033802 RepID=U2E4T8_9GAMM|nr:UDP-2,3-diacylglucosamine diphosphatase [Salinisphaera shabanensis]ERJ18856.1 UDP-23-diacylglucosamine hydrolase protein [Salinisphaera shabanensis E1L3A]
MATHLLADVHLIGDDDPNAQRLIRYLDGPARAAEAVYVLGDLFDVWVGDDGSLPMHARVIDRFAALARSGVPLYFMRGNRDFAVGEAFVAASHMQILNDPIVVDLYGTPTLLSHGDIFCTDDTAHQKFRARYTDPRWRARMMKLPLWLRRHIAKRARKRSRRGKAAKPAHIMDVNAHSVRESMHKHGVSRLIHGHTHRPDTHPLEIDGQPCERIVIADWRPACAQILVADPGGVYRRDIASL